MRVGEFYKIVEATVMTYKTPTNNVIMYHSYAIHISLFIDFILYLHTNLKWRSFIKIMTERQILSFLHPK